jgi:hypothetical protein
MVKADKYLRLNLKLLPSIASSNKKQRLASLTKDLSEKSKEMVF